MPPWCATSLRAAVLTLMVGLAAPVAALGFGAAPASAAPASGASATTASAASAASAAQPALLLSTQSPWVTPTSSTFRLGLEPGSLGSFAGLSITLTLYPKLTSRSVFEQTAAGGPTNEAISRAGPLSVGATPGESASLAVPVTEGASATSPSLDLGCEAGSCSGVYPLVVSAANAAGTVEGRLTTFLTFAETTSTLPLRFAWVLPIGLSTPTVVPTRAARSTVEGVGAVVQALAGHPDVPTTVAAPPQMVQALALSGTAGTKTLSALAALSYQPAITQFLAQPYAPVDANALAAAGLTGELTDQMDRGDAVLAGAHVALGTGSRTWVDDGAVGSAFAKALDPLGASHVVLPDTDVASATGRTPTDAQPFELTVTHGRDVLAAAADSSLAQHFTGSAKDPVLAANQLLADLALVHYEAPSPSIAARGLVAVPPVGWSASPSFLDTLLAGLDGNPNVAPVTLDQFFAQVPVGGNGWPDGRTLADTGPGPALSATLAHDIAVGRLRLAAFAGAVVGGQSVVGDLNDQLLAAESSELRPGGQGREVVRFERALDGQLSLISLATERTITLTSRSASIPVTILSAAHYGVQGTLTLQSDKLQFGLTGDSSASAHVVINRPTNAVRFGVVARTSGDLPLEVTFVTPNRALVIAHGQLTVRSTATSVVGVLLTLGAAVVLAGWWARTWRTRRRARSSRAR